jgi:hypothetical protein
VKRQVSRKLPIKFTAYPQLYAMFTGITFTVSSYIAYCSPVAAIPTTANRSISSAVVELNFVCFFVYIGEHAVVIKDKNKTK